MGPFTMVVLIVMIVGIVRIVQARHGVRPRARGDAADPFLGAPADAGETARLRDDLLRLKDRVAVLERIATDGDRHRGLALEQEIEALRERREQRAALRPADGEDAR